MCKIFFFFCSQLFRYTTQLQRELPLWGKHVSHCPVCSHAKPKINVCVFRRSAENRSDLSRHGVTHILNAAHSELKGKPDFYEGMRIAYMGVEAHDIGTFDMGVNFQAAADFIHRALGRGGGPRFIQWKPMESLSRSLCILTECVCDPQARFWCTVTLE